MEEIILLGAVSNIEQYFDTLNKLEGYNVVEIWDNFYIGKISYNGNIMEVIKPYRPEIMRPILILSSRHENEIRNQLIKLGISEKYIKTWWYCFHRIKNDVIAKYSESGNPQIIAILEYLKTKELHVFNGGLFEKYQYGAKDIEVFYDDNCGLHYSYWEKHKIYMKRGMEPNAIKNTLNALRAEQDKNSPHCYEQLNEIGRKNDVIVDAGAAEGFFSLERADTARHIYIVECDEGWIEALGHTFEPYKEKVTIIRSFLGDKNDDRCITLDKIDSLGDQITVIKMDIEGEEEHALEGGRELLSQNRDLDVIACSYHKSEAYSDIAKILIQQQFELRASDGYIFFPYGDEILPELRHGLIFAKKEKTYNVYIWGLGRYHKKLRRAIKNNCKIAGLLDAKVDVCSFDSDDSIMNPQVLKSADFDYVLITTIHSSNIVDAYREMGLPTEKLICLWDAEDTTYDFIDYDILKCVKQQYYLEKYKLRLANAPYEFSGKQEPKIIDVKILLKEIYEGRKSLARFGDGEFEIMRLKERPWFQEVDKTLAERLKEVLNSSLDSLCLAVADNFGNLNKYTDNAADGIREYLTKDNTREEVLELLSSHREYYDAYVSRPYIIYKNKYESGKIFDMWKKILANRDILLVEGRTSRMGADNDLLSGTNSVRRILCPDINAFQIYGDILDSICLYAKENDLVLIKLGPSATVLSYDLTKKGYQAVDIGQLDNEYDWYKMGVTRQVKIKGKMVAEVPLGRNPDIVDDEKYKREIVCCLDNM